MTARREDALYGRWVHSHEEDSDDEVVFRPATHPFPPARGRTSFELRPDGTYVEWSPGPVDVPEQSGGSWSLHGDRLIFEPGDDRPDYVWQIKAVDGDRLVLGS